MTMKRTMQEGWVLCPRCKKGKVLRLRPETRAVALEVHCKRCNQRSLLDIGAVELRAMPVEVNI